MKTETPLTDKMPFVINDGGCKFVKYEDVQQLERELNHYHAALDKQLSVTLGQTQTIRELRAKIKDAAAMPNVGAETRPQKP